MAGFATKYNSSNLGCMWQFCYEPLPPGSYEIAEVLALNDDGHDVQSDLCYIRENGSVIQGA